MRHYICYYYFILSFSFSIQALATPLEWMKDHVGTKEVPDKSNRGILIDEANTYTGVSLGSPWCASIISLAYKNSGLSVPRDARAAGMFTSKSIISPLFVMPGDLGGIYFPKLGRIGHVFMVRKIFGSFVLTVEGNTNRQGSRDGDGLFYYIRPLSEVRYFSRWPYGKAAQQQANSELISFICPLPSSSP